jgi:hypothetical protein
MAVSGRERMFAQFGYATNQVKIVMIQDLEIDAFLADPATVQTAVFYRQV